LIAPAAPEPRAHDRRGPRAAAGSLRTHGLSRHQRARHGGRAGVCRARAGWRLHADGRLSHESDWPHRRPGAHPLHGGGPALTHRRGDGEVIERVVDPLGLVAKASIWYLVSAVEDEMRVFRLSRTLAAELLDEPCERPPDFDLVSYWATWRDGFKASLPKYPV